MIIMDEIEGGYKVNSSDKSDYGTDEYTGGVVLFSVRNGVDFSFSKLNHHVFFEDNETFGSVYQIGVPVNLSSIYEERLDFVEGTGCIKIEVN